MNRLRDLLCCVLVMSLLLLPGVGMKVASASAVTLDATDVEMYLDTIIGEKMDEYTIPNMTVSVVYGGEVILSKGYGYADYSRRKPVDPETLFRIGSTSKLFTWTAVMQLVEQGKLDLDTDVNEYLDFEIPNRLELNRGQEVEPITIRHLMSHTPGFEDYMSEVFTLSEVDLLPLDQYVRKQKPARVFAPGEVSAYSNYGVSLAGYIVEVVSGRPFAQYVEENIYRPLGMTNSTFRQPVPAELAENLSRAYRYVDGEFLEAGFEFFSEPAGSMSSSAMDMAKFMLAYLQGGQLEEGRILEEETVRRMFAGQYTQHPALDGMAHGFFKATFNGRDTFHHPGGTMLYDTGLLLIPDEQVGFFISHSGGNFLVNIEIFQAFMDRYLPTEGTGTPPEPTAGMAERAREFTGEYYQNRRSFTTIDALLSLIMGQVRVETDSDGYLLISYMGEINRFVEVEPGVYANITEGGSQDFGGVFRTIVFGTDTLGKTMLMTDGPMSYSRAAWYETSGLTLLLLLSSALFITVSLLYWGVKALVRKIRGSAAQNAAVRDGSVWAKRAATLLGMLTLIFFGGFLAGNGVDPVYGLPTTAFTNPSALSVLIDATVPYAIVLLALTVFAFAVAAWGKGYWKLAGRIHFTMFSMLSVVLSWIFYFWNVV